MIKKKAYYPPLIVLEELGEFASLADVVIDYVNALPEQLLEVRPFYYKLGDEVSDVFELMFVFLDDGLAFIFLEGWGRLFDLGLGRDLLSRNYVLLNFFSYRALRRIVSTDCSSDCPFVKLDLRVFMIFDSYYFII